MKFVISISKLQYIDVEAETMEEAELKACEVVLDEDAYDVVIEATGEVVEE